MFFKKDDRKEAALYDGNAIGVYKQLQVDRKPEFILTGHLPMELSFLMHSFLKSRDDYILIAEVIGARKWENGWLYLVFTMHAQLLFKWQKYSKAIMKVSALYKHMKIKVSGTAII